MLSILSVTQLLSDYRNGQVEAMESLFPIVYQELRRIAQAQLRHMPSIQTICTTALVHEAYLKLVQPTHPQDIQNRSHFFAIAATAMRQVLINYAEQKQTQKRGGGWQRVDYTEAELQPEHPLEILLTVNEALIEIEGLDSDLARLIELKFFAGMTEAEIAEVFGVTERTVRRNWRKARALLTQALEES